MLGAAGCERLDELITAITKGSPLVEAAARRLEQCLCVPAADHHAKGHQADRELVDVWLGLVMDVAAIVADRPRLADKELGARLQQMSADIAAVWW